MTNSVLYCPGCNERFEAKDGTSSCPNCGQTMATFINAPTMEFSEVNIRDVARASVHEVDQLVGTRLANYDIESILGQGGMGRVYKARHRTLERACAVKVLNSQLLAKNPTYVDLFLSEARAAASLVHPHVVTIHNIGEDAGRHFIEMEYIVGRSLANLLEKAGKLDPTNATRLILQISAALKMAHDANMVHRDIKPANVLVTSTGDAKLADFGLAKRVASRDDSGMVRQLSGTPYFMAPELFSGHNADPRSDVYAMGVTYFSLLAGQLPFLGRTLPEIVKQHESEPVPSIHSFCPNVPDDVTTILERCLDKDPAQRYAAAGELHDDLASAYGSLRSLRGLLDVALTGAPVTISAPDHDGSDNEYQVVVRLKDGRSQTIRVCMTDDLTVSERLVKIFSVCGPSDPTYFQRALELNAVLPHGSIGLESVRGQLHFVMTNTYPKATCDPEELRKSVLSIADYADRIERYLTSTDNY